MYAKLYNGYLVRAPKMLNVDGDYVYNPTEEQLVAAGYKPVESTNAPEAPEGYYYESGWEEQEEVIVQTWTLVELPDDIDDAEAFDIIFGGVE